jgi:hypothetical protein
MNTFHRITLRLLLTSLLLLPFACSGDDANCVDLCEEGQARDCTSIKGSCSAFCDALLNVESDAGCVDERERYQDCLNSQSDICVGCAVAETDLSDCVGTFCLGNASDPDCQTLVAAFQ